MNSATDDSRVEDGPLGEQHTPDGASTVPQGSVESATEVTEGKHLPLLYWQ